MKRLVLAVVPLVAACHHDNGVVEDAPVADAAGDAAIDAPVDAPLDVPVDAPVDAPPDAPIDAPIDAEPMVAITVHTHADADLHDATLVAFQRGAGAGAGAWTALASTSSGTYTFSTPEGAYAVAVVCTDAASHARIATFHATTAERTTFDVACFPDPTQQHTVSGTVINRPDPTSNFHLDVFSLPNTSVVTGTPSDPMNYSIVSDAGARDLIFGFSLAGGYFDQILIARDLDVSADLVHDVDGANAVEPTTQSVSFSGGFQSGDSISIDNTFISSNGTRVELPNTSLWVPATALVGNDVHRIGGWSSPLTDSDKRRISTLYKAAPSATTLAFPQPSTTATATEIAGAPYTRLHFTITAATADRDLFTFSMRSANAAHELVARVTPGYLGSTLQLDTPDLSGVAGWQDAYADTTGSGTWEVDVLKSNRGLDGELADLGAGPPPAGLDGLVITGSGHRSSY
jgi:hypothetical protein